LVVRENDILIIKVLKEWIEPGTEYAQKSWACTFNRMGKSGIYERMINIVHGITVQKATEYLLKEKRIEFETKDRNKGYEIDRYNIFVNGKKLDIKSNRCGSTFSRSTRVGAILDYSALVPTDQLHSRTFQDEDFYIFAFLLFKRHDLSGYDPRAVISRPPKDGEWIVHGFWDYEFLKPPKWTKEHGTEELGCIEISSSSSRDRGKRFLLGGTMMPRKFQVEKITLNGSNPKFTTANDFFQLFFIRSLDGNIPNGKITIKCENSKIVEVINPVGGFKTEKVKRKTKDEIVLVQNDWDDIWLYDPYVYFAGYMTKGDFKDRSEEISRYDKTVKQFEPQTDNNRLLVHKLNPIKQLFEAL